MSSITDNDPAIQQAFEQLDRLRSDPELMELYRQRRLDQVHRMLKNQVIADDKAKTIMALLKGKFN